MKSSIFLANLHHSYAQTDGTYKFPNSLEGDLLKTAMKEITQLRADCATQYNAGLNTAIIVVEMADYIAAEYKEDLIRGLHSNKGRLDY